MVERMGLADSYSFFKESRVISRTSEFLRAGRSAVGVCSR